MFTSVSPPRSFVAFIDPEISNTSAAVIVTEPLISRMSVDVGKETFTELFPTEIDSRTSRPDALRRTDTLPVIDRPGSPAKAIEP